MGSLKIWNMVTNFKYLSHFISQKYTYIKIVIESNQIEGFKEKQGNKVLTKQIICELLIASL